jgi:hypothetical protein
LFRLSWQALLFLLCHPSHPKRSFIVVLLKESVWLSRRLVALFYEACCITSNASAR